ncbi:MAG: STAS domain-containing protein [Chitinivibrionales bacterium]|nr:STAS domain-containing protein [Chitinivibrionales bacterium]
METKLDLSDHAEYHLITIKGRFTADFLPQVQKAVEIARSKDFINIAFDLHLVAFIDSAALGFIANKFRELTGLGGGVYLIGIPDAIIKVFEATKLIKIIPNFPTIAEADKTIFRPLEKQDRGFYFLFRINGNFNIGILQDLRTSIEKTIKNGQKHFLFDLSRTTLITSSGIGLLANVQKMLLASGGKLVIAGATGMVFEALETTHIFKMLKQYPSIADAELEFDIKF